MLGIHTERCWARYHLAIAVHRIGCAWPHDATQAQAAPLRGRALHLVFDDATVRQRDNRD